MAESMFYSWLRHIKSCQIVQTNWTVSPLWKINHEDELQAIMNETESFFEKKYGYGIYKKNRSLSQLIRQGECDVIGMHFDENWQITAYAIDVAFHESGLNYGSHDDTVMRVIKKCIRTAMCIYGCFDLVTAEVFFASPKINPAETRALIPCLAEAEEILRENGLGYNIHLIANENFNTEVLQPLTEVSGQISDTTELFMRSRQMYNMFFEKPHISPSHTGIFQQQLQQERNINRSDNYKDMAVGMIARTILRQMLTDHCATEAEIGFMQSAEYSKQFFHLNYPLLVPADSTYEKVRYYAAPLTIYGKSYKMCSQWFETPSNDDRPYLLKWIETHKHSN